MAWDVGAVLGGIVLGLVIDATSYATGFFICGLLPFLGIALYLVMPRSRPAPGAPLIEASAVTAGDTSA
jgi:predicted MFS family arabinose efflux permease